MRETRREFAMALAAAAGCLVVPHGMVLAQKPARKPTPPPPSDVVVEDAPLTDETAMKRAVMQQNAKEYREGVSRLFELASNLKEEVEKTRGAEVLSISVYRKTEEIEKLAKRLKSKVKG